MPVCFGVLLAGRFRREDVALRVDPLVVDRLLPPAGRNYSADFADGALAGQVSPFHHDPSDAVRPGDYHCAQRQLPITFHPPDGALGQAGLHRIFAEIAVHHQAGPDAAAQRVGDERVVHSRYRDIHHSRWPASTEKRMLGFFMAAQLLVNDGRSGGHFCSYVFFH